MFTPRATNMHDALRISRHVNTHDALRLSRHMNDTALKVPPCHPAVTAKFQRTASSDAAQWLRQHNGYGKPSSLLADPFGNLEW